MIDPESATAEPELAATTPPAASPPMHRWVAPAWFLLGVLVGIVGLAAYTKFTAAQPAAAPAPDAVALREAARNGTLDAIATLSAGGSLAESRATSTPVAVKTAVAANQIGAPNAPVTIVEFSDFQ